MEAAEAQSRTPPDVETLARHAMATLEEYQGEEIICLDVRARMPLTDYMIIASGRSRLHVQALRDHLMRNLKKLGAGRVAVEGGNDCDWVLVDGGGVWVHLFHPQTRKFYNLEKLWSADAPAETSAQAKGGEGAS